MPKVLFNIKKLQLSPITAISAAGVPTYDEPIAVPGTVSLSLDPEGESDPFYADGIVYYAGSSSSSYTGTLENALFSDAVLKAIYGYVEDSNKNIVDTDQPTKEFGAQFAVDSDDGEVYFTFYRCSSTKPNLNFQTNEDSRTINPQSVDLTLSTVTTADGKYNLFKSYATKSATNYATYFESIEMPTIPEVAAASLNSVAAKTSK